jgi:glutamate-5-semialdehyde dehydrogenase
VGGKGVEMRCDVQAQSLLRGVPGAKVVAATEQDWARSTSRRSSA